MLTPEDSRTPRTIPLLLTICLLSLPAYAKYSGGTGVPDDPYQITTAADLIALGETPEDYDKHFILTADIDLDPNLPGRKVFDKAVICPEPDPFVYTFPEIRFSGTFDGQGHVIRGLTIYGQDGLGLFGKIQIWAHIKNLGLEDTTVVGGMSVGGLVGLNSGSVTNCYAAGTVTGTQTVGGLVGRNDSGIVLNSHSTGTVIGTACAGGLVGWNYRGFISNSDSMGTVSGTDTVGGLLGYNDDGTVSNSYGRSWVIGEEDVGGLVGDNWGGSISNSYSAGTVSGTASVGGLAGRNYSCGTVSNSYNTSAVSGGESVGGLVGYNDSPGTILNSYSTGRVRGGQRVGGLVGHNHDGTILNSFWDIETSGQSAGDDAAGLTSARMQDPKTFLAAGWDFQGERENGACEIWQMGAEGGYPVLSIFNGYVPPEPTGAGTVDDPYILETAEALGTVWYRPWACYRLAADIDLSGMIWSQAVIPQFIGQLDGRGHVIRNMAVSGAKYLGLVGSLVQLGSLRQQTVVSNLGLADVNVAGTGSFVGGLVGYQAHGIVLNSYTTGSVKGTRDIGGLVGHIEYGTVRNSYSAGSVHGSDDVGGLVGYNNRGSVSNNYSLASAGGTEYVGGLLGYNYLGTVLNSYAMGMVTGTKDVGGLLGYNFSHGTVSNSYSAGVVTGMENVGGLVGENARGPIWSSFWDVETSGLSGSNGGVGLTRSEMMDPYTLSLNGFGGDPNWVLNPGRDYPRLAWEGTAGQAIPEPRVDWLGGAGTAEDPYRIDTPAQLMLLRKASILWDKHFLLIADIDLDPNLPGRRVFGDAVIAAFAGVFDGGGHEISNLSIRGYGCLGLFGQLAPGATVEDLGLAGVNVIGAAGHVGALVGCNVSGTILNSHSTGSVSAGSHVGSLVGYNDHGIIVGSHSTCTVSSTDSYAGGLVGYNDYGTIVDSYSAGSVHGSDDVGGLVGYNERGILSNDHSTSSVVGADSDVGGLVGSNVAGTILGSHSAGPISGTQRVGGLVGSNGGAVSTSYSEGSISGTGWYVGGLVGSNRGTVSASYSTASARGAGAVGGLMGSNGGTIAMSYSAGTASGTGWHVGGLVGSNEGTVLGSFSTGMVSGTEDVGGLVGNNGHFDVVAGCFWDVTTSGQATSDGGTGKTTAEMQTAKTFLDAGWDFVGETANGTEDIWWIDEGKYYPKLWWQAAPQ